MSVTHEAGEQADSAELRLHDRGTGLRLPRHGSELKISLGYADGNLTEEGRYIVVETGLDGPPDTLVIRARGTDLHSPLKIRKTRSWDDVSLQDLVAAIASEHGLES